MTDYYKPRRTTWARGAWRENGSNADGLPTTTAYSDSTPAIALTYDAFQRLASASNSVVSYSYMNSHLGMATNESVALGGGVSTLTRAPDHRHRVSTLALDGDTFVAYSHDAENRLATVYNSAFVATYAYTTDSRDAGYTLDLTNGVTLARAVHRDPYRRNLVSGVTNTVNGSPVSSLAYTHDILGRPTARNADTFGYNHRSEVTSATIGTNTASYSNSTCIVSNAYGHQSCRVLKVTPIAGRSTLGLRGDAGCLVR